MIGSDLSFWKICLTGVRERDTKRTTARRPFTRPLWLPKREAQQPKWGREYVNEENREDRKGLCRRIHNRTLSNH